MRAIVQCLTRSDSENGLRRALVTYAVSMTGAMCFAFLTLGISGELTSPFVCRWLGVADATLPWPSDVG